MITRRLKMLLAVAALGIAACERDHSAKEVAAGEDRRTMNKLDDPPVPSGDTPGRFVVQTVKQDERQMLLRLDTFTGRAWLYQDFPVTGGQTMTGWSQTLEAKEIFPYMPIARPKEPAGKH